MSTDTSFLVLIVARDWALSHCQELGYKNPHLHLDITNVDDVYGYLFRQIPQTYGLMKLDYWSALVKDGNTETTVVYDKDEHRCEKVSNIYLKTFEEGESLFAALYDENAKRIGDKCLIFWNKKSPDITNIGYACGKCPALGSSGCLIK